MITKKKKNSRGRVIFDTNVFISVLFFNGEKIKQIFKQAFLKYEVCFSEDLKKEILIKIDSEKFVGVGDKKKILKTFDDFIKQVAWFFPQNKVSFSTDPKDAFLLELAQECEADFLVTGDKKHLLPMKKWEKTKILSPQEFDVLL